MAKRAGIGSVFRFARLPRLPSYRVRIKPSWKARVYGTYHITPYHLVLPLTLILGTLSLLIYLGYLNMNEIDLGRECAVVQGNLQYHRESLTDTYPREIERLNGIASSLFPVSYKIYVITGLAKESIGGLLHDSIDSGLQNSLEKLRSDIEYLETRRFEPLKDHLETKAEEWEYTPSVLPVLGDCRVTSGYGRRRNPFTRQIEFHKGIDLAAELHTKIIASAPGTVVKVYDKATAQRYGMYVILNHNDHYLSVYAHCNKIFVKEGHWVARGQVIAEVGSTGRSTGPHLHYEVRKDNIQQSPFYYIIDKDLDVDFMLID